MMRSWFGPIFSLLLLTVTATQVAAHGYITWPPSRAAQCKSDGSPTDCGPIQYEPQSVEAPKGMPFNGQGDGHLCSGGRSEFGQLDRQGSSVWNQRKVSGSSPLDAFTWKIEANHATTDFSYYITKPDWDASKSSGLRATDLESSPFLKVPMNGKQPAHSITHQVINVPQRSGYHVVYAVWTIADTGNAFYQCVDLDFGNGNAGTSATTASGGGNTVNNNGNSVVSAGITDDSPGTQATTGTSSSSGNVGTSSSGSGTSNAATDPVDTKDQQPDSAGAQTHHAPSKPTNGRQSYKKKGACNSRNKKRGHLAAPLHARELAYQKRPSRLRRSPGMRFD